VQETGYAAYRQKFELANGYPTYCISDADADVDLEDGCLRVVVPFSEAGAGWGAPPEVRLSTPQAERYLDAITAARAPFASR
jgi:hypothetical protein